MPIQCRTHALRHPQEHLSFFPDARVDLYSQVLTVYSTVSLPVLKTFGLKSMYTSYMQYQHHAIGSFCEFTTYLALLWSPIAIGIAVVDQLIRSSVADLNRGVGESAIGSPSNGIAGRFLHQERKRAALVSIFVEALLHGIIENLARRDIGS